MNIKEFSKIAGVSTATVSRALSGADGISDSTRARIIELAEKHNYINKRYKAADIDNLIIAVIVPEIKSEYYANIVEYLNRSIQSNGGLMYLYLTDFKPDSTKTAIKKLYKNGRINGFLALNHTPTIVTGNAPNADFDAINIDFYSGIYSAVKHLADLGHTNIGFVGERFTMSELKIFKKAIEAMNMTYCENSVFISSHRFDSAGYEGMKALLENNSGVTAVITGYDYIADGAISMIHEYGLKVPEDISVIGIDNIMRSANREVELTSIKAYYHEMCDIALAILRKKIKDPDSKMVQTVSVKTELVIRNSTAERKLS